MSIESILNIALNLGAGLMENGAETYRAEDTIERICHSMACENIQVFAIPTGIFLSVYYQNEMHTRFHRVHKSTIDLRIVTRLNDLSRRIVAGELSQGDIDTELNFILASPSYSFKIRSLAAGFAGGFFTLMFQGTLLEFIFAFFVSAIVSLFYSLALRGIQSGFMKNIFGGFVTGGLSIVLAISASTYVLTSYDTIIIGAIMPLVPGVSMTNAIRDSLSGELVAGITKLAETLIIATGIAIGVGIALSLRLNILGG